jgi:hypothetical protein
LKKRTVIFLLAVLSAPKVYAIGTASLDFRVDEVSTSPNDEATAAGTTVKVNNPTTSNGSVGGVFPSTAFKIQRLKIDYQNTVDKNITFRLRLSGTYSGTAATARDSVSNLIDLALVDYKISDTMSFVMGKQLLAMAGIEGSYNPADVYLKSIALDEVDDFYFATGATLGFSNDGQKLGITSTNDSTDATNDGVTASKFNQTRLLNGIQYTGAFLKGFFNLTASYFNESITSGATGVVSSNKYLAAGMLLKTKFLDWDLSYMENKYAKDPSTVDSNSNLTTTSIVSQLRYKMDAWNLIGKIEESHRSYDSTNVFMDRYFYSGTTVALEWRPDKKENFRYHVAYTSRQLWASSVDKEAVKQIFVGVRILSDFLK